MTGLLDNILVRKLCKQNKNFMKKTFMVKLTNIYRLLKERNVGALEMAKTCCRNMD